MVCRLHILKPQDWLCGHCHVGLWNQKCRCLKPELCILTTGAGGEDGGVRLTEEPGHTRPPTNWHLAQTWGENFERLKKTSWLLFKCTQHLGKTSLYSAVLFTFNDLDILMRKHVSQPKEFHLTDGHKHVELWAVHRSTTFCYTSWHSIEGISHKISKLEF